MVYRSINSEAPNYLSSLFERLSQNTIKELRNTTADHKLPLLKTSDGQICFSDRRARIWNNLRTYVHGDEIKPFSSKCGFGLG